MNHVLKVSSIETLLFILLTCVAAKMSIRISITIVTSVKDRSASLTLFSNITSPKMVTKKKIMTKTKQIEQ